MRFEVIPIWIVLAILGAVIVLVGALGGMIVGLVLRNRDENDKR